MRALQYKSRRRSPRNLPKTGGRTAANGNVKLARPIGYTAPVAGNPGRRSVNKTTKILLIIVVVLCLAYPGFAWLIGLRVEASLLKREQLVMDQYPGSVVLISRQYQRGVYGATEELIYGLGATTVKALAPLAATSNMAGLHVIVRNSIHHGPLPQFKTIGLATFTTQIELPGQISAKLRALLGGEPEIEIQSRLGWLGGVSTTVISPGFEARLADGTQLGWHGLTASTTANATLSATSIEATVDSVDIKSAKFQGEMTGLKLRTDLKRALETLYTGPFTLKIKTVQWQSASASTPSQIQGLSIDAESASAGEFYKSGVQFEADAVKTSGWSITQGAYDISLEHLHGPTLAALMKDARASGVSAGQTQTSPTAMIESMKKDLVELLLHEPVLNISRIGFRMPEGELRFSATMTAPGLKREDLEGPQFQGALMQHLNVVADIRVDAALVTRLMADNARKDSLSAQIDAFEHQGYIKRDGAALTAHVTFAGGAIAVNGHPYPPPPGT